MFSRSAPPLSTPCFNPIFMFLQPRKISKKQFTFLLLHQYVEVYFYLFLPLCIFFQDWSCSSLNWFLSCCFKCVYQPRVLLYSVLYPYSGFVQSSFPLLKRKEIYHQRFLNYKNLRFWKHLAMQKCGIYQVLCRDPNRGHIFWGGKKMHIFTKRQIVVMREWNYSLMQENKKNYSNFNNLFHFNFVWIHYSL